MGRLNDYVLRKKGWPVRWVFVPRMNDDHTLTSYLQCAARFEPAQALAFKGSSNKYVVETLEQTIEAATRVEGGAEDADV